MQKSMTITRALSRIKTTKEQLAKLSETYSTDYVTSDLEVYSKSERNELYRKKSKSDFDTFQALLEENAKLKLAVHKANETTNVNLQGKEFLISEVLTQKELMKYRKNMLHTLRHQSTSADTRILQAEEQIERKANEFVQNLSKGKTTGLTKDELDNALELGRKSAIKELKRVRVEGFDVQKFIEEETKKVDEFLAEVDYVLSEINATTVITVDLA